MAKKKPTLVRQVNEGEIYAAGGRHRRIIRVLSGRVFYSRGGDVNFSCKLRTFRAWLRDAKPTRIKK